MKRHNLVALAMLLLFCSSFFFIGVRNVTQTNTSNKQQSDIILSIQEELGRELMEFKPQITPRSVLKETTSTTEWSVKDPVWTPERTDVVYSIDKLVGNVCNYIKTNKVPFSKTQDFESFQSTEMHNFALRLDTIDIFEPDTTSIGVSPQELAALQKYMTQTALPFGYDLPLTMEGIHDAISPTYPYKVSYLYRDEGGTDFYILIDYNGNLFLGVPAGAVQVKFDPIRTIVHTQVANIESGNTSTVDFDDSLYPELDKIANRVSSLGKDAESIQVSINELDIITRYIRRGLFKPYNGGLVIIDPESQTNYHFRAFYPYNNKFFVGIMCDSIMAELYLGGLPDGAIVRVELLES